MSLKKIHLKMSCAKCRPFCSALSVISGAENEIMGNIGQYHYDDVIMSAIASQITSLMLFTQPLIQAQIKENIKAPRNWPLWGEFTGDRWIPRTKGQ